MQQTTGGACAVGVKESAKVRRFYKTDEECKELEGGDWATKLTIGTIVRCIKKNLTYRVDWNGGTTISCNVSDHTVIAPEIDEQTSANPTANATSETAASNGCVLFSFPLSRVLYI
jgi:hypothetical protein